MTEEPKARFEIIMIIDDTALDLFITTRIVTKVNLGKQLLQYSTVEEALEYLKLNQENINALPDIIFLDIYMPLMSGFDFLDAYEKLSDTLKKHCKLFIVSSTTNKRDISRIREDKNVKDILEKPLSKEYLQNIQK